MVGDVIRVHQVPVEIAEKATSIKDKRGGADKPVAPTMAWRLTQIPVVQGALVSMTCDDGAIQALVGGFDFNQSKFNRVMQALRQPGSNFKPFLYSAALEAGFTPASLINDAPIVFDAPGLDASWRPENYTGEYIGPTRLREALSASRNLVSIRLLRAIGIDFAAEHAGHFGFADERLPRDLSLALGTGVATPLEVLRAYAVFANGGYLVDPYFIERVETADGSPVMQADPVRVCRQCEAAATAAVATGGAKQGETMSFNVPTKVAPRVISAENAWMMNSMMQDVIKGGTARRALALKRGDIAGKTGTTNEQRDAWFSGFNSRVATTTWVGFDQTQPLGKDETGARAALPMWIEYMRVALDGMEEIPLPQPQDLVTVRINPSTGNIAGSGEQEALFETFRSDEVPGRSSGGNHYGSAGGDGATDPSGSEQLF
jgi:penicillin-binding protein 1A